MYAQTNAETRSLLNSDVKRRNYHGLFTTITRWWSLSQ